MIAMYDTEGSQRLPLVVCERLRTRWDNAARVIISRAAWVGDRPEEGPVVYPFRASREHAIL